MVRDVLEELFRGGEKARSESESGVIFNPTGDEDYCGQEREGREVKGGWDSATSRSSQQEFMFVRF